MEELGTFHVLELFQNTHHVDDIVAVEGPEIADVHAFKDILLMAQRTLDGIVQPDDALAAVVVKVAFGMQPSGSLEAQLVVSSVGVEVDEILLHAAHGPVYRHIVVVEDDEHIVGRRRHVVEPLKGQTAAHGSVADDSHDMAVAMPALTRRHSHTQSGGDAVGSMAAGEGIIFTLQRCREGTDAAKLAVGAEAVAAAGENLMAIGLVTHIPDDTVVGSVEDIVQGHRELYHTKTGGKVAGIDRHLVDDVLTELTAHLGKGVDRQTTQVRGILYLA